MKPRSNWQTSTRRSRLPPDWPTRRRRILHRDNHTCRINGPHCTGQATEVDHIHAGDNHAHDNLQAVCATCHRTKTHTEAHAAKPPRKRPPEPHPGLAHGGPTTTP